MIAFQLLGCCLGFIALAWAYAWLLNLYISKKTIKFFHPYLGEVFCFKNSARSSVVADEYSLSFNYSFPMPRPTVDEQYVDFLKGFLEQYPRLKAEFGKCAIYEFNKTTSAFESLLLKNKVYIEKMQALTADTDRFINAFDMNEVEANEDGTEFKVSFESLEGFWDGVFVVLNRNLEVINSGTFQITG